MQEAICKPLIELEQNVNYEFIFAFMTWDQPLIELEQNVNDYGTPGTTPGSGAFNRTRIECKYISS